MLITIALLALPGYIIYTIIRDNAYKNSIKYVHKRYVFNQYTLTNDHCTVKYTPDEKLVVTDNINKNTRRKNRTFTIEYWRLWWYNFPINLRKRGYYNG